MRTIAEIMTDVYSAMGTSDTEMLISLSDELVQLDTPEATAQSKLTLGTAYRRRGDNTGAFECFQSALDLLEVIGDKDGIASATGNLGIIYANTGDMPTALEHYQKALDIHDELGDKHKVALATGNIGVVYNSTGDNTSALEHYGKALDLHEELGDLNGVARVTGNIGNLYGQTGNFTEAIMHYQKALDIRKELGDAIGEAYLTGNLASMHIMAGRVDEATALLDRQANMPMEDPVVVSWYIANRARVLALSNDYEGAHEKFIESLEIVKDAGLRKLQADYHKEIRDLAQKRNDFAGYIEHNDAFTKITEEINGKATSTKMAMQSKQREIDAVHKEHEKHMAVLHSTLPKPIADRVARGETVSDHHENAAVVFMDVVDFTTKSSLLDSNEVTQLLAKLFDRFDTFCDDYNVTKIKTIGDSYMAVAFDEVGNSAQLAVAMIGSDFTWPDGSPLQCRVGIHSGPVTAGVIGTQRLQYDVWGDTVNVASRMESSGEPGRIHVSEAFAAVIPNEVRERGTIDIKGKGPMKTFWLEGA